MTEIAFNEVKATEAEAEEVDRRLEGRQVHSLHLCWWWVLSDLQRFLYVLRLLQLNLRDTQHDEQTPKYTQHDKQTATYIQHDKQTQHDEQTQHDNI